MDMNRRWRQIQGALVETKIFIISSRGFSYVSCSFYIHHDADCRSLPNPPFSYMFPWFCTPDLAVKPFPLASFSSVFIYIVCRLLISCHSSTTLKVGDLIIFRQLVLDALIIHLYIVAFLYCYCKCDLDRILYWSRLGTPVDRTVYFLLGRPLSILLKRTPVGIWVGVLVLAGKRWSLSFTGLCPCFADHI